MVSILWTGSENDEQEKNPHAEKDEFGPGTVATRQGLGLKPVEARDDRVGRRKKRLARLVVAQIGPHSIEDDLSVFAGDGVGESGTHMKVGLSVFHCQDQEQGSPLVGAA